MLTPNEMAEILNEVNEKHGWQNLVENSEAGRKIVKYVDTCLDTRDGTVWVVKMRFRDLCSNLKSDQEYGSIVFNELDCTKEKILNWLRCN